MNTDTVILENVKTIFTNPLRHWDPDNISPWAERSDTYMYLTCMHAAGWDTDYADVITISGFGPGFMYSQEKWWAHYYPPPGRDARIAHATGFGFQWQQYKSPDAYWNAIKHAVDEGKPVYGPYMEGVLFIGYRDADNREDRRVAPLARVFVDKEWWTWDEFVTWHTNHSDGGWFGCHTERVDPWPEKASAVEVLETMLRMATDDPRSQEGITCGPEGIKAYADDLADVTKSGAREEEGGYFQGGWRGCHNIYPHMSGRPAAATYLKRVASLFEEPARQHILTAAAEYEKATAAWYEFEKQLGRPLGDTHNDAWQDPRHRTAGAAAVYQAYEHEKKALDALSKALEIYTDSEAKTAPGTDYSKEAVLDSVVDDWNRITDNNKGHCALVGGHTYEQPYVYLVAHVVEMHAAGWKDVDFDLVAAVSGASALFGYEPNEFMPKYAHLMIKPHERIAAATGFGYEWVSWDDAEKAFNLIKQSIDSGIPVKGWDWENCIFAGYRDHDIPGKRQVFVMAAGPDDYAAWRTWDQFMAWINRMGEWNRKVLGRHTKRVPSRPAVETAVRVIRDLVAWAEHPPQDVTNRFSTATFGLAGITAYARACADTETYPDWSSCHDINPQWTIRNSSASYLQTASELFSPTVKELMLTAAAEYRSCFAAWQRFYDLLGHHAPEGAGHDPKIRAKGASLIEEWLEHESTAVGLLKQALSALAEKE